MSTILESYWIYKFSQQIRKDEKLMKPRKKFEKPIWHNENSGNLLYELLLEKRT